jgi:hypothetical protein
MDAGADLAFVKDWLEHANIQNTKFVDINFYLFTSFRNQWYSPFRNVAGYLL